MARRRWWDPGEDRRWVAAVVLAVVPIIVATVRAGLGGWTPAGDAAVTVLRAGVMSLRRPDLVGMYTDASEWVGEQTFFPGPWQLWWMAPPTRLLGSTWGPILSMALLNSLWVVLVAWVLRRRFGTNTAVTALVFLGMLTWAIGVDALFSPIPMVMIVPAFAAFVLLAWAVASGDDAAVGWFALSVGFCLLNHLVLTILVPVIAGAAVTLWAVGVVRERRSRAAPDPERVHTRRRGLLVAGAVTVAMWLPAVIQELTTTPGNLSNLLHARANQPTVPASWSRSLSLLVDLFTPGHFWFNSGTPRSGFSPRIQVAGQLGTTRFALFIVATIAVAALLVATIRRRDRPAATALVIAGASFGAAWVNQAHPTTQKSINAAYYVSNRVVGMFVTVAVVYAIVRLLPFRMRSLRTLVPIGLVAVFCVVNLTPGRHLADTTMSSQDEMRVARSLNRQLVGQFRDDGTIELSPAYHNGYRYKTAFIVAANDAGVPVCAEKIPQLAGTPMARCTGPADRLTLGFTPGVAAQAPEPGWIRIARADALSAAQRQELAVETAKITATVAEMDRAGQELEFTTEEKHHLLVHGLDIGAFRDVFDSFNSTDALGRRPPIQVRLAVLARIVRLTDADTSPSRPVAFDLPGTTAARLSRWAELEYHRDLTVITVWASRRPTAH